jgi:hypothetical protein
MNEDPLDMLVKKQPRTVDELVEHPRREEISGRLANVGHGKEIRSAGNLSVCRHKQPETEVGGVAEGIGTGAHVSGKNKPRP